MAQLNIESFQPIGQENVGRSSTIDAASLGFVDEV
jgi:hypothetical protein